MKEVTPETPAGTRVRVKKMAYFYKPIPEGTVGTLVLVNALPRGGHECVIDLSEDRRVVLRSVEVEVVE